MHLILDHQEKNLMGDLPPSNDDGNDRDEKASKDPPKDCSSPSWLVRDEQQRGQHLGLRVAMVIMLVKMALMARDMLTSNRVMPVPACVCDIWLQ